MNQQQQIEDQLWAYIDGLGTDAERAFVATRLQTDVQWQHIYSQLSLFNDSLQQNLQPAETTSTFTQGVMNQIAPLPAVITPASKKGIPAVMMGIAAFFVVSLLVLTVYMLSQINWGSMALQPAAPTPKLLANLPGSSILNTILCAAGAIVLLLYAEIWLRHKRTRTA
jgi:anti-sigma factor RsiW